MGTATRRTTFAVWAGANTAIGFCAYYPLLALWLLSHHVLDKIAGRRPDYPDENAYASLMLIVFGGGLLTVVAILVNRALHRQLGLFRWHAVTFWVVTILVLVTPFGYAVVTAP